MRSIFLFLAVMAAACTKKNPEACCVDEADCAAIGLPNGSTCNDGLTCRGNRCVELDCSTSAQCDPLAPYCAADEGLCRETCSDDNACPGFAQAGEQRFCEGGACVACRSGMNDCSGSSPVCDAGSCRRCNAHAECSSGVCTDDGSCALSTDIAYVSPSGSPASACTSQDPCTLSRALQSTVDRTYVLLASGAYQSSGTLTLEGRKFIIGAPGPRPIVTRTGAGPIFTMAFGAEATIDSIEVSGALNTTAGSDGVGILCNVTASLRVLRSTVTRNAYAGVSGTNCTLLVSESTLSENFNGINVVDTKGTIERSIITRSTNKGLALDAGIYTVTNNFIVRNATGIDYFPSNTGTVFQFNTVVDNTSGVLCQVIGGGTASFPNNLVARNGTNTMLYDCSFAGSFVTDDIAPIKFKSPDVAPFDYHLTAGSVVVDQISASTQTKDFDGESRPAGTGHDYGADELH